MTRTTRLSALLVVLVTSAALPACTGKTLSFDKTTSTMSPELASIDGGVKIVDLTDDQANALCSWLIASYPVDTPPGSQPDPPEIASGYVTGYMIGCAMPPSGTLGLVHLAQDACMQNLRHSACEATLASLEQCVTSLESNWSNMTCGANGADCTAFEAASGCDQTVIQSHMADDNCANALPVVPSAACPAPGLDGGAD